MDAEKLVREFKTLIKLSEEGKQKFADEPSSFEFYGGIVYGLTLAETVVEGMMRQDAKCQHRAAILAELSEITVW